MGLISLISEDVGSHQPSGFNLSDRSPFVYACWVDDAVSQAQGLLKTSRHRSTTLSASTASQEDEMSGRGGEVKARRLIYTALSGRRCPGLRRDGGSCGKNQEETMFLLAEWICYDRGTSTCQVCG